MGELLLIILFALSPILFIYISDAWKFIEEKVAAESQKKRDLWAGNICEEILYAKRSNLPLPEHFRNKYSLYLRPFYSTSKVKIVLKSKMLKRGVLATSNVPHDYPGWGRTITHKRYVKWGDLETELAKILEYDCPLIALGKPGEQIGAGRIQTSESTWQSDILFLAEGANLIFLLASTREGTAWEIRQIIQNDHLLRKCIFIVPPDDFLFGVPRSLGSTFASGSKPDTVRWEDEGAFRGGVTNDTSIRDDVLQAMRSLKLGNFENAKYGCMFILGVNRRVLHEEELLHYHSFNGFFSDDIDANLNNASLDTQHLSETIEELQGGLNTEWAKR